MASKYWIKLYHEILDDPKMGRMPDRLWRRTIELFLLAGEMNKDGLLPPVRDIGWRLRIPDDQIADDMALLETYNIVSKQNDLYIVTKFADRQSAMTSTERTQRWRDSQKHDEYKTVHYGNRDDTVTKRHTDKDIDIDKETEEDTYKTGNSQGDYERSPLIELFEKETKIAQPSELIDPKGFMVWEKEIAKWESLGVTDQDIKDAIEKADELKSNLSWPGSITKYMASAIARRERGISEKDKEPAPTYNKEQLLKEIFND